MVVQPSSEDQEPSVVGIILAGTFPWAHSAFNQLWSRPLIPVAHRPLISYALSWMRAARIEDVFVCGNRDTRGVGTQLLHQLSDEMGFSYLEDPMPRGTAGCVRDAALSGDSETYVVADGAAIPNVVLATLLTTHRRSGAAATVVVYSTPRGGGRPASHTPAGVYVFERRVLELVPRRGFCDIKEHLIPNLVKAGERVMTYASEGAVPRVLNEQTYLAVNEFVIQSLSSTDGEREGYYRRGESLIHEEASVSDDATLVGPLIVGPGACIQPRAVLIGPTSIGREVTVGARAVISRSAIWRRSTIHADAIVDRSIIADDAVIQSGRHEHRTVVMARRRGGLKQRSVRVPSSAPARAGEPIGSLG
jgi:NDP-sugar pyrophosphorylase family protein